MPDTIANAPLSPGGEALMTPPLKDFAHNEYRVVLEGTFRCLGETFDALYLADGTPHNYLLWSPVKPSIVSESNAAKAAHRYEFQIPANVVPEGQSLSVQLDIDRLIDRFLVTRSEIVNGIEGEIRVTVLQLPLVAPFPWATVATVATPAALVAGGITWVLRRRMAFQGMTPELLARINRIQTKAQAARQAAVRQSSSVPIRERIETLASAALPLARQCVDLSAAQKLASRDALNQDITALEHRLAMLTASGVANGAAKETEATLEEKRKALTRLDELARAEALCILRLEKIEAILDSAALTLHSALANTNEPASEEHLRKALDAEVAAVHAVSQEAPKVELLIGRRS